MSDKRINTLICGILAIRMQLLEFSLLFNLVNYGKKLIKNPKFNSKMNEELDSNIENF